jgi:hypothetical protein
MRVIVIVPAQRRRRSQTPGKGDFRLSTGLAQEMQKVGSRYFGKFRLRDQSVQAKPAQDAENQAAGFCCATLSGFDENQSNTRCSNSFGATLKAPQ